MVDHQRTTAVDATGRRPRRLLRSPTLWVAGASAVAIAATAAVAGPLGPSRLAAAHGSPALAQTAGATLPAAGPDFGRRRGHPGAAPTPVAKVSLSEADSGKTITVKPGTEIDVTLKPDSGKRWSPPRSDHPQNVSGGRSGGWQGRGWGGGGRRHDTPDFGPGGGKGKGDGSTHATFFARRAGDASLSSAERGGGGLLLLKPPSGPSKSWSVKVTVSGPAPAAPKPAAPAAIVPAAPAAPSVTPVDVPRLVTPVTPAAVKRLLATLPRL